MSSKRKNLCIVIVTLLSWISTSFCADECAFSARIDATASSNEQLSCRTNPIDNGIASNIEFPHIVLVIGKIFDKHLRFNKYINDTQCAGSLVTKLYVITSTTCINGSRHTHASIKFGVSFYNEDSSENAVVVQRENFISRNQLTLMKLPAEIETNELISPTNFPSIAFENLSIEKLILAGWTGYKYECNQQLKKWFIWRDAFESCGKNLICLNEADIVNYREMLVAGSPLQIYHPDDACNYMLVAVFTQIINGHYEFIDFSSEDNSNFISTHIY